ncbi:Two-component response regulator ARR1 [Rhynchospora pubera]|uniref:Two-component response regulator ARR1 n=1 Tax=Rhynchospora pubera TaxID=906938 RepID=A0AAV8DMJ2_9POAL|nr:Two-component response regulator ARR1 [Rhynchospora pubera]
MGEVGDDTDYEGQFALIMANQSEDDDDEESGRVRDWVMGLPRASELHPLNKSLVPPELASAFQIPPEPGRSAMELNRASHHTFSSLSRNSQPVSNSNFKPFTPLNPSSHALSHTASATADDADSTAGLDDPDQDQSARTLRRPRLVWTPQLHKRFVDVVSHLGLKNAVPKTIMQLMNVEGLTRENVASHLQKYRLYVKRMAGLSNEEPASPSDNSLFASTPVPQSFARDSPQVPVPMSYATVPGMYPVPVFGMGQHHHVNGHGHHGMGMGMGMGMMPITGGSHGSGGYSNGFGPSASYPHHVNHGDK